MAAIYQLVMHAGPTPSKIFPLEGEVITIGRETGNNIIINDTEVSRRHTQLVLQGDKVIITDLGSTNGTFVDGQRLTGQHVLLHGQIISLGEQINLLFDTVEHFDPSATRLSIGHPPILPLVPAPANQPAPFVKTGPLLSSAAAKSAPIPQNNSRSRIIMVIILIVLCLLSTCVAAFWYIESNALWCQYLPFLFGSSCP